MSRICIIGPFFFPQLDGVEKIMFNHARHLAARGHDVHVVTTAQRFPVGQFDGLPRREPMHGFIVHRIGIRLRSPSRLFSYLSNSGLLLQGFGATLRSIDPDILHVHNIASPAWGHGAARFALRHRRKLFYSLYYHPDFIDRPRWENAVLHGLNRLPLTRAVRLFHLTRLDYGPFLREYPYLAASRLAVLPSGVDPATGHPDRRDTQDRIRLLFVGRVEDERKGFDLLEAAFARLPPGTVELTAVGRIGEAKRHALEDRFGPSIRVLGLVSEAALEQEYASTDVFVMPSRYEGFGMPYIEAMRYAKPVIGTTVGGIPDVVPDGTGLLVPPDDEPALLQAITTLLHTPDRRTEIGRAGQRWAEQFGWERVIDLLESHYAA